MSIRSSRSGYGRENIKFNKIEKQKQIETECSVFFYHHRPLQTSISPHLRGECMLFHRAIHIFTYAYILLANKITKN